MPKQARLGDSSSHGGLIISGSPDTLVNGRAAARLGDMHVCPILGHGVTPIVTGSATVKVNQRPAARVGDVAACGALIVTGSDDVYTG